MKYDLLKLLILVSRQALFFMLLQCLGYTLLLAGTSHGQSINEVYITVNLENAALRDVFQTIEQGTDFGFAYREGIIAVKERFTFHDDKISVGQLLTRVAKKTGLAFHQINNTISVERKTRPVPKKETLPTPGIVSITGKVTSTEGEPLAGVNILIKGTANGTITDVDGNYSLDADAGDILVFSFIGFKPYETEVGGQSVIDVVLEDDVATLENVEIFSTGYQEVPAERATGSFEHIDNELLNRSVSTDVISRLEGVTSGLLFDTRNNTTPGNADPKLYIRGLSSMYGSAFTRTVSDKESPLIIVDNFPYEGNLNSLNPNDVESITVLKDAAAASIWGARAGNGVIVITTKRGKFNETTKITFNSNITLQGRPNLFYNPAFLSSKEFINAERHFFDQGLYTSDESNGAQPVLSPAVEIFIKARDGELSPAEAEDELTTLRQRDVRNDIEKYLYRNTISQQYSLNFRGGSQHYQYYLSGGLDKSPSTENGDTYSRLTLNSINIFKPIEKLELSFGMYYSQSDKRNNGLGEGDLNHYSKSGLLPYARLADSDGLPLPIPYQYRSEYINDVTDKDLLDWHYIPLEERNYLDDKSDNRSNRFNVSLKYNVIPGMQVDVKYQYQNGREERKLYKDKNSYQVRDLVNRFTQHDGKLIFPYGGILRRQNDKLEAYSGRLQAGYNKTLSQKHHLTFLAGAEMREIKTASSGSELYGYDPDILTYQTLFDFTSYYPIRPQYSSRIPSPYTALESNLARYVSYYGNTSYAFDDRYMVSASIRWDASNLFGVKTNQKGVPLWSGGAGWTISQENFYSLSWLPLLKLRATYGYNGNIDQGATAYTTASFRTDNLTDLPNATITSPGNPQLHWEKVNIINIGIDFGLKNNTLRGSLEVYRKNSTDLIGPVPLDPTTGFLDRYNVNYASLLTQGLDLEVTGKARMGTLTWQINTLCSYVKDKVTDFRWEGDGLRGWYLQDTSLPVVERSLYTLYSYPWTGLDPTTGDPLVILEGQPSTDYSTYLSQLDPATDLVAHGSRIPTFFGSLRNTLIWKNFSLSANITWKAGHYFRRSALDYYQLYKNWLGHEDFTDRWQIPGDEKVTNVPSLPTGVVSPDRDAVYTYSEVTAEKGDHIRLQDVTLGYEFQAGDDFVLPVEKVKIYFYARNLGILWRANNLGLDPDYPRALYPPLKSFSLGVQIDF